MERRSVWVLILSPIVAREERYTGVCLNPCGGSDEKPWRMGQSGRCLLDLVFTRRRDVTDPWPSGSQARLLLSCDELLTDLGAVSRATRVCFSVCVCVSVCVFGPRQPVIWFTLTRQQDRTIKMSIFSLSLVRSLSPCTLQAEWGRWLNRTNPLEEWHPQRAIFGSLIPFLCFTLTSTTSGTVWCHLVQDAAAWLPHETPELNECYWNVCTFGSIAGSCCRICIIFNWSSFRLPSGWCFCFIWITFVSVLFSFSPHFFPPRLTYCHYIQVTEPSFCLFFWELNPRKSLINPKGFKFNNTYCCSEGISTILKDFSKRWDERILPLWHSCCFPECKIKSTLFPWKFAV